MIFILKNAALKKISPSIPSMERIPDGSECSRIINKCILWWLLPVFVCGMVFGGSNGMAAEIPVPKLMVPKCAKAPVIDGVIQPGEWADACAFTGFTKYGQTLGGGYLLPLDLQPVVYLTHNEQRFYLAVRNPIPAGYKLRTKKTRRDDEVQEDDAMEIFLNPHFGVLAGNMNGFYQFIGNSIGAIYDIHHQPGIGQIYPGWNGNWEFKNTVSESEWISEISIPFADMDVSSPADGMQWNMNFCRDYGGTAMFATWSLTPNYFSLARMAEITFRNSAPAVQILSLGDLPRGNLNLHVRLKNNTSSACEVVTAADIRESSSDAILVEPQSAKAELAPGEEKSLALKKDFRVERESVCHLLLNNPVTGEVYYEANIPFTLPTALPELVIETKKKFEFLTAYYPYYDFIRCRIDLADEPEKTRVKSAEIKVIDEATKKVLAREKISQFLRESATVKIPLPELTSGKYQVTATLFDEKVKPVTSDSQMFERKTFPWEHNTIGIDDEFIIPPYTPIEIKGDSVACLGRVYQIDGSGLFENVEINGDSILASSMKFTAVVNKKQIILESRSNPEFTKTTKTVASVRGESAGGKLAVTSTTTIEYDGFVRCDLRIAPQEKIDIDNLTLEIPISAEYAPLMHSWGSLRYSGVVPETDDFDVPAWSPFPSATFMPFLWIGNDEKGLAYFAEEDGTWVTDDKKASIEVVRRKKQVVLLLHFINKTVTLEHPIDLTIGFIATPVKPLPKGWRTWNSPLPKTELPGKRMYFGGGNWPGLIGAYGFGSGDMDKTRNWAADLKKNGKDKITVYMSTGNMPLNQPEFDIFKGEWVGLSPLKISFEQGYLKLQGDAYPYTERSNKAVTGVYTDLTQSNVDMRVWYFNEVMKNTEINGGYWDAGIHYPGLLTGQETGGGYEKEDGTLVKKWRFFNARQLHKRMATMYWQNNKESLAEGHDSGFVYIQCMTFMDSHLGGEWRAATDKDFDLIDLWKLDIVRVEFGKQWGLVPRWLLMVQIPYPDNGVGSDPMPLRAGLALCLLHDIIPLVAHGNTYEGIRFEKVKAEFGIGADDVEFMPYWKNTVVSDSPEVKVSAYVRPGRYLLGAVNIGQKGVFQTVDLTRLKGFRIDGITRVWDAQTGENLIQRYSNGKLGFFVGRHDFRMIIIECSK